MVINTNYHAQVAASNLQENQYQLGKSLARLSSGSKIIDPSDDAAGLAVSNRLDAQVNRTQAAKNNVGNAVSFTQTQDGYLKKVAKALDRMSELCVLALDITKSDPDRALYNTEYASLSAFITNTATKDFNGISLFNGSTLDVTIDSDANAFNMRGVDLAAQTYATALTADIGSTTTALGALTSVKDAIASLATDRAYVGANQTRLNSTADQLTLIKENLEAASSRIRDVDVAEESTQYARENILVQSGTSMLAQANQMPQSVLKLLQ
jgi:flagellin